MTFVEMMEKEILSSGKSLTIKEVLIWHDKMELLDKFLKLEKRTCETFSVK